MNQENEKLDNSTIMEDDARNIDLNDKLKSIELLLSKLNQIGVALSIEKDISILMENILIAAKDITNTEGGTIYIFDNKKKELKFEIMINDVLKTHFGGSGTVKPPFPTLPVFKEDGSVNENLVAAYVAGNKVKVNIKDAYTVKGFDFSGTKKFDERTGYRSRSLLTFPMIDAKNQLLGVLQLINPHDKNGKIRYFNSFDEEMVESLASQASVALSNRLLLDETKNLFESMIKMINLALDEKSPYTNEHCQRVPILTMMIAEAVANYNKKNKDSKLQDFNLDEDGKDELRIAALLHDCGKIVTPVHVIDKSKKLQLLQDGIELIKSRADTIYKELELRYSKNSVRARSLFMERVKQLKLDVEFIEMCNFGTENLSDENIERIKRIAKTWTYKDRNDNICHLITPDEEKILSIKRGTLSESERDIINNHVTATIKMLESLPWPDNLKNVPEYAGGHHERMDGKGYPKGLTGDQMSIPARIMGVADVFEALSASNRPYKSPNKLSECLEVMGKIVKEGHLDPDIYEAFVQEKVYLKYAKKYLREAQIDLG